jgi:hypothetical protein
MSGGVGGNSPPLGQTLFGCGKVIAGRFQYL